MKKIEREKDFYCESCNRRTKGCPRENEPCAEAIAFYMRNQRIDLENRQIEGKITVADCIQLHGRLATLKILGAREMAAKLEAIEPIVERYRSLWETEGYTEEEIQLWIENRPLDEMNEIRAVFSFYIKEVGLFLSERSDEII